jgi:hypothetical protein
MLTYIATKAVNATSGWLSGKSYLGVTRCNGIYSPTRVKAVYINPKTHNYSLQNTYCVQI